MRLCLPFLGCSNSERFPKDQDSDRCNAGVLRSLIDFMKPYSGLWTEKKYYNRKMQHNEHQYDHVKVVKQRTLEELLFADLPGNNKFFGKFFERICPPFDDDCTDFIPREANESVSMERLLKVKEENMDVSSMSTSQSGKVRKRVSFKFPSEADIFIFYSSDVESDDQD